jgi:hypothetical protein
MAGFAAGLGLGKGLEAKPQAWRTEERAVQPDCQLAFLDRQKRQFDEMQIAVQNLVRLSPNVRERKWRADLFSVDKWLPTRNRLRDWVHDELIGRLTQPKLPFHPRTRLVLETADYVGYEIVLDVLPDVIASGILLR